MLTRHLPAFLNLILMLQKRSCIDVSTLLHTDPLAVHDLTCHLTDTPLPAGKRLKEPLRILPHFPS